MLSLNFSPFPTLSTPRLILRMVRSSDANAIYLLRSNKTVMQYLDRPLARSLSDGIEMVQKIKTALVANDGITWAISLPGDEALIGTIGYWRILKDHYRAEIGYMIQPSQQGKGLMKEAIEAVLKYGFQDMKLHSVEANVNPGNLPSINLLEKCGFVKEAHFRENYYYKGLFLDSAVYSLISPF